MNIANQSVIGDCGNALASLHLRLAELDKSYVKHIVK